MISPLELHPEVSKYVEESLFHEQMIKDYGEETCSSLFRHLLAYLSTPPSYTTLRINVLSASASDIRKQVEQILTKQYKKKDWPPPVIDVHPMIADMLVIRNDGPHDIKQVENEVIIDLSCGTAVLRGADIYIQGILAATPGMRVGDEVSVYVDLDRGCRKGLTKPYEGRKLFVGNGMALCSRQDVFCSKEKTSGVGIQMTKPLYQSPSLSGLIPDLVYPQNLPSIVCSHVLDPQPGELILDMCAAPGGKTSHIATLMRDKGRLVALDKSKNKTTKIRDCCQQWGLHSVEVYAFDATKCLDSSSVIEGAPPYPPNTFSRILLDAPCSGLGQRPSLKSHMTLAEVSSYPPLQRQLFSKAVELLAPGGILVYSTCTITVSENEDIVTWALKEFPDISLQSQSPHIGRSSWPHRLFTVRQCEMLQRFGLSWTKDLSHSSGNTSVDDASEAGDSVDSNTIGFFIAKFIKLQ
ncbi:hypothetical protein LSH36_338g01025 [Paralvinella palmiformis]|uniref:SAM-dependent MTase RsmB/NOP-type domain-containing protein n=1 Tax=Paralvinella palmiformis TaxID=53620 RepID=A0AAD9JFC6_9ANNE|nr:hypothetical protein LSH36_338g01025 [Paralvinella palmiformis]